VISLNTKANISLSSESSAFDDMPSSRVKAEMLRVKQNLLVRHSMSHRNDVVHMCEWALAIAQSVSLKSSPYTDCPD
jgi:hypothetical protein